MNIPLSPAGQRPSLPPLENGDRLDQKTFHERYEAMPEHVQAELIGGIVYMSSPLRTRHGMSHSQLQTWLTTYQAHTPGTAALDKRVAETAAAANIAGLEFYFGIPGSIGGALPMNAGANNGETKDVLIVASGIGRGRDDATRLRPRRRGT